MKKHQKEHNLDELLYDQQEDYQQQQFQYEEQDYMN